MSAFPLKIGFSHSQYTKRHIHLGASSLVLAISVELSCKTLKRMLGEGEKLCLMIKV